jgi:5'/3'-nucleotidase
MRALIANDDGIDGAGLRTLAQVAVAAGLKVTVAAPDSQRSGSSAAMSGLAEGGRVLVEDRTLDGLADVRTVAVRASPAMIVFLGAHGAFGEPPDVVLAGINRGPNLGRAILHSGTVGAALTAQAAGLPAMAVSLASARAEHWDTAAAVATRALTWFLPHAEDAAARGGSPGQAVLLNVNAPDLPPAELRGLHAARLSSYEMARAIIGEPGQGFVPVTFSESGAQPGPGTDLALIRQGWATATVLTGLRESDALDLSTLG